MTNRRAIREGGREPMAATVRDVAKLAGVSTATVSRVINNDPRISSDTRKKVFSCIRKLDYRVNNIARSLKTNRTGTIGFLAPEIANDFFMLVAKGVETELKQQGYSVIVCNSDEKTEEEVERIRLLWDKRVDGIIIIPASGDGSHLNMLQTMNIPVVLADRLMENFTADAVVVDNEEASYQATQFLISRGCRKIGFIGGKKDLTNSRERHQGYLKALEDNGIAVRQEYIRFGDFHVESGYRLMKELLDQADPPEQFFIANYFMNVGATKCLLEHGRNFSRNIIIASFDEMEITPLLDFPQVVIAQPILDIGRHAARILLKRIHGEDFRFPHLTRLKTQLKTYKL